MEASSIVQLTSVAALAIISGSFALQKLLSGWKATTTESSLIDSMHKELDRMSKQNTILSQELNKLQIELISLNTQLRALSSENQRLHSEVTLLTSQVTRLQNTLKSKESEDDSTS
jgi:predicted nuclease with TOPRIM domain